MPVSSTMVLKARPRSLSERDITEAEGAHHGERPIDSREPRVVLTFPRHDRVEQPAVEQNDRDDEDHVFCERLELPV